MTDNTSEIDIISKEAAELLNLLENFRERLEINSNSLFLKYLNKYTISQYIIPYLNIREIINLRSTCRDLNSVVSSTVSLVSYYKALNQKLLLKQSGPSSNPLPVLKAFNDLNDFDDIQMELESLKKVK